MAEHPILQMLRALQRDIAGFPGATQEPLPQCLKRWDGDLGRILAAVESLLGSGSSAQLELASGISHRTRQGFVSLTWGTERAQMTADDARALARDCMEVAESAEYDAMFMQWLLDTAIAEQPGQAAPLLMAFRDYREHQAGTSSRLTRPVEPLEDEA